MAIAAIKITSLRKIHMWLKDPKDDKKSVSLTLLVAGFLIASGALFFKESFSASDWALVVGTVAGLYWSRRSDRINMK